MDHRITTTWNTLKANWLLSLIHKFVIVLFVLSLIIFAWRYQTLPPLVPLWYSRPWGIDQLAHPLWLLLLPMASLLWYGASILVSIFVTAEYLIFTQMIFMSSLIVSLLSFLTLIKILFLMT